MSRFGSIALLAVLGSIACSSDITAPTSASPADDLLITIAAPGACLVGDCDPITSPSTLGLITFTNTGNATVYIPACGPFAEPNVQQLVDGRWQLISPTGACFDNPRSIAVASHQSTQANTWFAPGVSRVTITVGRDSAMTTPAVSASASITVP